MSLTPSPQNAETPIARTWFKAGQVNGWLMIQIADKIGEKPDFAPRNTRGFSLL
jgi:hypothetical protein